jgi:hypothetical protein
VVVTKPLRHRQTLPPLTQLLMRVQASTTLTKPLWYRLTLPLLKKPLT